MRIGIIGSGHVGSSLAHGLARHGHDVMLGTRDIDKPVVQQFVEESDGRGSAGSYADAARFGDIVITAYPGALTRESVAMIGPENLAGKIVIDAANPIEHLSDGTTRAAFGDADSAAEVLQRMAPGARVVKAYNTVGSSRMVDPNPGEGLPTMRIAGDDADAKAEVGALLASTGWRVRDLGGLVHARQLEHEAVVWAAGMDSAR